MSRSPHGADIIYDNASNDIAYDHIRHMADKLV